MRHDLEPELARELLNELLQTYGLQYRDFGVATEWRNDQTADVGLCVKGRDVRGTIRITPDCYDLDFDVPFMFVPFKALITRTIDDEVGKWLANLRSDAS